MVPVIVTWRDAYFDFERSGGIDERDDYLVETMGWADPSEAGPFLSIVAERLPSEDGERAVTHIPVESVVRVYELSQGLDWFTLDGWTRSHEAGDRVREIPGGFVQEY